MKNHVTGHIRLFTTADKEAYKQIRLESLLLEPAVFGSSYAREAAFADEEWEHRLDNPASASFGLYDQDILIGTTGIITPATGEGLLIASYIREAYRGMGLSALLYQARIDWARARGIKRLIVSHRKSNLASKAANQHFRFYYTHSMLKTWPDGQEEDNLYYELNL